MYIFNLICLIFQDLDGEIICVTMQVIILHIVILYHAHSSFVVSDPISNVLFLFHLCD